MEQITLYYHPKTRASRPRWLLEELGLSYQLKLVNLAKGEQKHPDYLKIHPLGVVPAMELNGKKMMESAAMCMLLADRHAEKKLAPSVDSSERLDYLQWFFFFQNNIEPPLVAYFQHTLFFAEKDRRPERAKEALEKFSPAAKILEDHLHNLAWMLPNFSALDCFGGSMIIWAQAMKLLGDFPKLDAYANRLKERDAWKKAVAD